MNGILTYGAYIPRRRLQRATVAKAHSWLNPSLRGLGKGERAMANWDEDTITMAVEASRNCLADIDREQLGMVILASTSAPNADRQNAGIIKEALNLSDAIGSMDASGGLRAGTTALIQSLRSATDGKPVLCVASEKRLARPGSERELLNGDAAAALLIGTGNPIATLVSSYSSTIDFIDHVREAAQAFEYGWESRWIRDEGYNKILAGAIKKALAEAKIDPAKVDRLIIPVTLKGVSEGIAGKLGVRPEALCDNLGQSVGESGTAHPILMLSAALDTAKPGEIIVVSSFGQGCDVLIFEVTAAILDSPERRGVSAALSRGRPEDNYFKFLFFNDLLDVEKGMRAEADFKQPLTALYRNRRTVMALVGGRCTKTGTVQFPRSDIGVNANDHSAAPQEDYPLAEKSARILTFTADNLTYTPDPPARYGMIEFDGGGRMVAEFVDSDPQAVVVGAEVRMVFRIKDVDKRRGFTKYFWKAVIAD